MARAFSLLAYIAGMAALVGAFWFMQYGLDKPDSDLTAAVVITNVVLFLIFPAQHSLLARSIVKDKIAEAIHPVPERSVYVATSGIALGLVILLWRNPGPVLLEFNSRGATDVIFYAALLVILWSTATLGHGSMFGLKRIPSDNLKTTGIYGIIRHPITSLFLVCLWSHDNLTAGRLLFNVLFTVYSLAGTIWEERDLVRTYGQAYLDYRRNVPAFVPGLWRKNRTVQKPV